MHPMKVLELILLFAGAILVISIDVPASIISVNGRATTKSARVRPFGKSAKGEKSGKSKSAKGKNKAGKKEKGGPYEPPFGKSDKGGKSNPATHQYKVFAKSQKSKKQPIILGSKSPIPTPDPTSTGPFTWRPTVGMAMATGEPVGEPTTTAPPSLSKKCKVANEIISSSGIKLNPSEVIGRSSNKSIAIHHGITVVGAPVKKRLQDGVPLNESTKGAAFVFERDDNCEWFQTSKLVASDGAEGGYFGRSVAVSDDTIVVGAFGTNDDFRGSVHVFVRSGSAWVHQAKLVAPDGASKERFGNSVAIHRDTIVIGAPYVYDYHRRGSVHVFVRNGYGWIHQAKLVAPDTAPRDKFGYTVDIHENSVAVGEWGDGPVGGEDDFWKGSVNIFVRSGNTWTHQAKLLAPDGEAYDQFGRSIGIDADSIVVGATANKDDQGRSGSAYVFDRNGDNWIHQAKLLPPRAGDGGDRFGCSVSIHGNLIIVGADADGDNGIGSGSAHVFVRNGRDWRHQAKLFAPDIAQGDSFGARVSVHNGTALVGSHVSDYVFSG